MLVAKIAGYSVLGFGVLALIIELYDRYNAFCKRKFGRSPLHLGSYLGAGVAGFVFLIGFFYYHDAVTKHKDVSDAIALIGLGGLGILITLIICVRVTDPLHGVLTTLILLAIGTIAAPIAITAVTGAFLGLDSGQVRYVERKRFWEG